MRIEIRTFKRCLGILLAVGVCLGHADDNDDGMTLVDNVKPSVRQFKDHTVWEKRGFRLQKTSTDDIYGKMGLKDGDLIREWNGKKITNASDLKHIIKTIEEGKGLIAIIERGGKEIIFRFPEGVMK